MLFTEIRKTRSRTETLRVPIENIKFETSVTQSSGNIKQVIGYVNLERLGWPFKV